MQQDLVCPGCGSPISATQKYCGVCGTMLFDKKPVAGILTCPYCGAVLTTGQQICAVCGNMVPATHAMQDSTQSEEVLLSAGKDPVSASEEGRTSAGYRERLSANGMLTAGRIVFSVLGWIVLIPGCIASAALIVLAVMGGGFRLLFGDVNILGTAAIAIGIAGFILSLIIGFQFLVISHLCYAIKRLIYKSSE